MLAGPLSIPPSTRSGRAGWTLGRLNVVGTGLSPIFGDRLTGQRRWLWAGGWRAWRRPAGRLVNSTARIIFGELVIAIKATPTFCAASLGGGIRSRPAAHRHPCSAFSRFRALDECIEGSLGISFRIGHPNLLRGIFGWLFATLASSSRSCAHCSRVVGQISRRPEAGRALACRLLGLATRRCPRALYPVNSGVPRGLPLMPLPTAPHLHIASLSCSRGHGHQIPRCDCFKVSFIKTIKTNRRAIITATHGGALQRIENRAIPRRTAPMINTEIQNTLRNVRFNAFSACSGVQLLRILARTLAPFTLTPTSRPVARCATSPSVANDEQPSHAG